MLGLEDYNVKQLLKCLEWANNEIAVEPYKHSTDEQSEVHNNLRAYIDMLQEFLYGRH